VRNSPTETVTGGNTLATVVAVAVALLITLFLIWITYGGEQAAAGPSWASVLAPLAASANAACAICLALGWRAIRGGRELQHRNLMLTAVFFSAIFFVSYVTRHHYQGDTPFEGAGLVRVFYLSVLATHIIGSMVVLVLLPLTLRFAWLRRFDSHRALNHWLLPIWLYVSVTGVLIYFMLR
jgi:putative membrane protein